MANKISAVVRRASYCRWQLTETRGWTHGWSRCRDCRAQPWDSDIVTRPTEFWIYSSQSWMNRHCHPPHEGQDLHRRGVEKTVKAAVADDSCQTIFSTCGRKVVLTNPLQLNCVHMTCLRSRQLKVGTDGERALEPRPSLGRHLWLIAVREGESVYFNCAPLDGSTVAHTL